MSTVRIVKMVVAPYAVLDDGTHLTDLDVKPLEVQGGEIEEFVNGGLAQALEALRKAYSED